MADSKMLSIVKDCEASLSEEFQADYQSEEGASTTGSPGFSERLNLFFDCCVLGIPRGYGFAAALSRIFKLSRPTMYGMLNDDVLPKEITLRRIVRHFRKKIGADIKEVELEVWLKYGGLVMPHMQNRLETYRASLEHMTDTIMLDIAEEYGIVPDKIEEVRPWATYALRVAGIRNANDHLTKKLKSKLADMLQRV